jgi:hypothetical protein
MALLSGAVFVLPLVMDLRQRATLTKGLDAIVRQLVAGT